MMFGVDAMNAETLHWTLKLMPVALFLLLWSAFEIISITDLKSTGGLKQFRQFLNNHPLNTGMKK